jgi:C1A family cysteine protease
MTIEQASVRQLGRRPDSPDERDLQLRRLAHLGVGVPLPGSADVFAGLDLPVYDQGDLGSCTANAGVLYRRFLAQRFPQYSAPDQNLSRLFLYYAERALPWNQNVSQDAGASTRDTFYALSHLGVCPESDDPYVPALFASPSVNDSTRDLTDAQKYRIGAYHRIPDCETARSSLASGYAVLLGVTVYPSFEQAGKTGIVPMPSDQESVWGGHAIVIRGYDDTKQAFLCQNSWGKSWGINGCFWLLYAYIEDAQLSQPDMWMGHLGGPWRN